MCGIFGIVGLADTELGERIASCLHHRGPDDCGVWASSPLPLGEGLEVRAGVRATLVNTRLAIIDLSPAGHQPMCNEDGSVWIAFNGELYNFQEVRPRLEGKHIFRSHSDTEVLIHAYEEWGEHCLKPFRGMFAFAIWDMRRQRLFAARDRLGEKPFYYAQIGDKLIFASELKAILASGLVRAEIDPEALHHYLSFFSVPPPFTLIKDVRALPAGHSLTYENGHVSLARYWDIPAATSLKADPVEIRRELRRQLEASTRLRMIADVPVGAFLSGGVDSSSVVALMARISGERLKTFSIGFEAEGRRIDERSYASIVARRYATDHHEVVVTGRDMRDQLDRIVWAMDQPTGDGLNTYFVSQATAQHVKVALSGLGGDELFAGYPQFADLKWAEQCAGVWRKMPGTIRAMGRAGARVGAAISGRRKMAEVPDWLDLDFLPRYARRRTLFNEETKLRLYSKDWRARLNGAQSSEAVLRHFVVPEETEVVDRVSRLELKGYMSHTLLRDTDAMSMAHSLEVRVPLIDHQLVEFITKIPPSLRQQIGPPKRLLTETVADLLPPEVTSRRKQGFEMPVARWLASELRPLLDDVFAPESVRRRGIFDPEETGRVYRAFLAGERPYMRVWALAALELWARRFLD